MQLPQPICFLCLPTQAPTFTPPYSLHYRCTHRSHYLWACNYPRFGKKKSDLSVGCQSINIIFKDSNATDKQTTACLKDRFLQMTGSQIQLYMPSFSKLKKIIKKKISWAVSYTTDSGTLSLWQRLLVNTKKQCSKSKNQLLAGCLILLQHIYGRQQKTRSCANLSTFFLPCVLWIGPNAFCFKGQKLSQEC